MYSVTKSFGLNGLRGFAVAVEADVSGGLPAFSIVGLPDSAVRESKRVIVQRRTSSPRGSAPFLCLLGITNMYVANERDYRYET